MDTVDVYKGVWINWTNGLIRGATLTVSEQSGSLLISFVAVFVAIVGNQLWRIISFTVHQLRSTTSPRDGLHHQQQAIFRNTSAPAGAGWSFLLQAWYWRGTSHSLLKTTPWAVFSILYLTLFGVLTVFSSQVSNAAGTARLIHGDDCGIWELDENINTPSSVITAAYQQRMANESIVTSTYARACYGPKADRFTCGTYPVPSLQYTSQRNASCPFASGMCVYGDTAALRLTTKALDSHHQLGINAPSSRRIEIYKEVTCAPLVQLRAVINGSEGETDAGTEGHVFMRYLYGGIGPVNYTYQYNTQSMFTRTPFTVYTVSSVAPHDADAVGWNPINDLALPNTDISLVFIASNSMRFETPVDDPVFGAHYEYALSGGGFYYEADEYNVAVGCADTYRVCNPNNGRCTDSVGIMQFDSALLGSLDLSNFQRSIVSRTQLALMMTNIYYQVEARLQGALRAQETAAGIFQPFLPADQWEIEVSGWFEAGLSRLQFLMQEYAAGPASVPDGSHVWSPGNEGNADALTMCHSQIINDAQGTTSFSILGLSIIFGIGGVIVFTSLIVEMAVGSLQVMFQKGVSKKQAWLQDDKLQMQRIVFETAGLGVWKSRSNFPVTAKNEKFRAFYPDHATRHSGYHASASFVQTRVFDQGDAVPNTLGHKDSDVFMRKLSS